MADPVTPVTSHNQKLFLEILPRTGRSVDSGYGSVETSPTRKPCSEKRAGRVTASITTCVEAVAPSSFDGNSSEESKSGESSHEESDFDITSSPSLDREKFATLPRASRRRISRTDSTLVGHDRTRPHQRHGSDETGLNGKRVNSLKALDRFVPMRDHATPGSEKLRTTKALEHLTPSERLVRHNQDAPDPFCFRRRALPPSPTEARRARRSSNSRTVLDMTSNNQPDRRVSLNLLRGPLLYRAP